MEISKIKVGQKVVDRYYSFKKPATNEITGIGTVIFISEKRHSFKIKFKNKILNYDRSHVLNFIEKDSLKIRKLAQKHNGFIPKLKKKVSQK